MHVESVTLQNFHRFDVERTIVRGREMGREFGHNLVTVRAIRRARP